MTRARKEKMSQRQFVYVLRFTVDNVRQYPTVSGYSRIRALIAEHPGAMRSRHITHNLGEERMAWLRDRVIPHAIDCDLGVDCSCGAGEEAHG